MGRTTSRIVQAERTHAWTVHVVEDGSTLNVSSHSEPLTWHAVAWLSGRDVEQGYYAGPASDGTVYVTSDKVTLALVQAGMQWLEAQWLEAARGA